MFKRIFLVILDSAGIGEAKDASKFDDEGTNTIKHAIENNYRFFSFGDAMIIL